MCGWGWKGHYLLYRGLVNKKVDKCIGSQKAPWRQYIVVMSETKEERVPTFNSFETKVGRQSNACKQLVD